MHGTFEKSREVRDNNVRRSSGVGFLAVPVVIAVALVGLAITKPEVSTWIAEAAQAEFAGSATRAAGERDSYCQGRLTKPAPGSCPSPGAGRVGA